MGPPSRARALAAAPGAGAGTRFTGWGVVRMLGAEPHAVACDVISPKSRLPIEQRLEFIFTELQRVITEHAPTTMAIESPFVGENVRSAMAV